MKLLKYSSGIISGLLALGVYLLTVSHSVTAFDSGELAAVQSTLGIAHPPGYPLFTILGYLFLKIPLGIREIYQLNILSSVWCAAAVTFFTYTSQLILGNLEQLKTIKHSELLTKVSSIINENGEDAEVIKYIVSIVVGLFFAFSLLLWLQSTVVEVYSMQFFLFSLIIFLFFKIYFYADNNSFFGTNYRNWIIIGVLFGCALSNHFMTFYLLPAFLFLYFQKYKLNKTSVIRLLVVSAITIVIAISLYFYLIIRAGQHPVLNWGNPDTISSAIDHISAKYYKGNFFAGFDSLTRQLKFLFNSFGFYDGKIFAGDYNINLIFCLTGMVISLIALRRLFYFIIILFFTTVLITVNYDIPDIYEYFSLSIFALYIANVPAVLFILNWFKKTKYGIIVFSALLLIFLFVRIGTNYSVVDKSREYLVEDYVRSILKTADNNSVIFTSEWEYIISPSYYLQFVEGYRNDINIVSSQLIPLNWYKPDFVRDNNIVIDPRLRFIDASPIINKRDRTVYLTPEIYKDEVQKGIFKIPADWNIIPDLFLFRVVEDDQYYPGPGKEIFIRKSSRNDLLTHYIYDLISHMFLNRINYELSFNKYDIAKMYYLKLKKEFPDFTIPAEIDTLFISRRN